MEAALDERAVDPDPVVQFNRWFAEACAAGVKNPDAMTLATVTEGGRPAARVVLLKRADAKGFVFYTNYRSRKGRDLAGNSSAALVFYWPALDRQVRVEGRVVKISRAESDRYFQRRPRESQIGALASPQSEEVGSRGELERRFEEIRRRYQGKAIPRPHYWGGYRLQPSLLEFWLSRPARMHDRVRYERRRDGRWRVARLAP